MRIPSQALINQLKRHEGFSPRPYLCSKNACTIGYGTNLEAHPRHIPWADIRKLATHGGLRGSALKTALCKRGMEWTAEDAERAMLDEVMECRDRLEAKCPQFVKLAELGEIARAEVLLNMAFNLGVPGLLKFRNTLAMLDVAIARKGSYAAVAKGMSNSLWARQVKARARQLARQMETGIYQ